MENSWAFSEIFEYIKTKSYLKPGNWIVKKKWGYKIYISESDITVVALLIEKMAAMYWYVVWIKEIPTENFWTPLCALQLALEYIFLIQLHFLWIKRQTILFLFEAVSSRSSLPINSAH